MITKMKRICSFEKFIMHLCLDCKLCFLPNGLRYHPEGVLPEWDREAWRWGGGRGSRPTGKMIRHRKLLDCEACRRLPQRQVHYPGARPGRCVGQLLSVTPLCRTSNCLLLSRSYAFLLLALAIQSMPVT